MVYIFFKKIYIFIWERQCVYRVGKGKGRGREFQAESLLSVELNMGTDVGFNPTTHGIMTHEITTRKETKSPS